MTDSNSRDQVYLINRRPIFDRTMRVRYYELNPGPGTGNRLDWLISLTHGWEKGDGGESLLESLAGGRKAVIRLSPEEILSGGPELLPPDWLVWPRVKGEANRPSLTAACQRVKRLERGLVLDEALTRQNQELAWLADILALEGKPGQGRFSDLKKSPKGFKAVLMAVNLGREPEVASAMAQGCRLFQGRFYSASDPDPGQEIQQGLGKGIAHDQPLQVRGQPKVSVVH